MSFFDINNVIFTILGYDLNGLELLGFITGIIAIYLASCGRVLNFVVGLLNCIIYFAIFFQANLYSMMLLQLIFVGINVYGILKWTMPISNDNKIEKGFYKFLKEKNIDVKIESNGVLDDISSEVE